MNAKICPSCNTSNNPSFTVCWHCQQLLDQKILSPNAIRKKEAYDAFKLSKFSYLFNSENLKLALWLSPTFVVTALLNFLLLPLLHQSKLMQIIIGIGPGSLALGWCVKYLLPQRLNLKIEAPENIFLTGLKLQIYTLLPAFILSFKLMLFLLPFYLIFSISHIELKQQSMLIYLLVPFQIIVSLAPYATVTRYLYIQRENSIQ